MHLLGQATDIVVRLDHLRRIAANRNTFDHIRIERPLREKAKFFLMIALRKIDNCVFEDANEFLTDDLSLLLGINDVAEILEKTLRSVDVLEFDMKIFAEHALDNFFLTRAQQAIVD